MLTGRCTADPHKTVYKQNHTRGQSKLQLCALFIVAATPRSSGFFGVFLLGRTFVTLPLCSLPVAPHFALFLGLGGTSLVAPQSLRGVSPGDVVGGKQAWTPPRGLFLRGRASIAVWGPCSGLISSSVSELCLLLFPLRILKLGHQLPLVPTRAGVVGVGSSFSLGTTFPASRSWEQRQEPEVRWLEA